MSGDEENFLRRWSRLKRRPAVEPRPPATPRELPPLETLNFESDFGAFMHAEVDAGVRRAALKALFRDPRFNIMDGLDVYIDDYSKEDPISSSLLAQLRHAQTTLFGPQAVQRDEEGAVPQDEAGTPAPPTSSNERSLNAGDADPEPKPELEPAHDRAHQATFPA